MFKDGESQIQRSMFQILRPGLVDKEGDGKGTLKIVVHSFVQERRASERLCYLLHGLPFWI